MKKSFVKLSVGSLVLFGSFLFADLGDSTIDLSDATVTGTCDIKNGMFIGDGCGVVLRGKEVNLAGSTVIGKCSITNGMFIGDGCGVVLKADSIIAPDAEITGECNIENGMFIGDGCGVVVGPEKDDD